MNNSNSDTIQLVIAHTLKTLGNYSMAAVKLLELTASLQSEHYAAKSQSGLGLYRIKPSTHLQIWDNYLAFKPDLASTVRGLASQKAFLQNPHFELVSNLSFASGIAWVIYQRNALTLPDAQDHHALTDCWARYFTDSAKPARSIATIKSALEAPPSCSHSSEDDALACLNHH